MLNVSLLQCTPLHSIINNKTVYFHKFNKIPKLVVNNIHESHLSSYFKSSKCAAIDGPLISECGFLDFRLGTPHLLQPHLHVFNRTSRALQLSDHGSLSSIHHPPFQSKFGCLPLSMLPEVNTLHLAKHFEISRD